MTADDAPARGVTHYSFVVDAKANAAYPYEAYLLTRSLVDLAAVEPADITAFFVGGIDPSMEAVFAGLGVATATVDPFGHPFCNKIQQLRPLLDVDAERYVLLDTDMFALRALDFPTPHHISGKIVDAPNPPRAVLEKIYSCAKLRLDSAPTDVVAGTTARANFNGGLYVIPRDLLEPLATSWTRWASWSLENLPLYDTWTDNVDQVSFALAVTETGLPSAQLPREYNVPTHLGPGVTVDAPPYLLHYHRRLDTQLMLERSGDAAVDAAVETANWAIARWRRADLANPVFWSARYSLHPGLGSGIGSRGDTLDRKREMIGRTIDLFDVRGVVDIGGGDGAALEGLAKDLDHVVTDAAAGAATEYLSRNPEARFVRSDITHEAAPTADLAICLDVLIHIADVDAYRDAVDNALRSGTSATLISGYDDAAARAGTLTYFHEPLIVSLERHPDTVAFPVHAYHGVTAYVVLRHSTDGHPRDARPATLRRAMALVDDPWTLLECVVKSRRDLGFFPDHLPRSVEYPWIVQQLRALNAPSLRVLDVGAGVNVVPLILNADRHAVTTVDAHELIRSTIDRADWNEWGFLDYAQVRPGITSHNVRYEDYQPTDRFDAIYSVSVVEHLPAEIRRRWFAQMAGQLADRGRLLLTLDLEPMSRSLWNRSEDREVEAADRHGSVDDIVAELRTAGFAVDVVSVRGWLPLSRVGLALIAATREVRAAGVARVPGTVPSVAGRHRTGARSTVTVLVPAYRPGQRFVGLLESLARQTYDDIIVRVALDPAPGHSMPALPDVRGKRLELLQNPARLGWVGNVNALLDTVQTPYYLLLMHDDQLTPDYIERCVAALEANPRAVVAHGAVRHHGIRDGDRDTAESIGGERHDRLDAVMARGPHLTGLGWRGVVRSEVIDRGARLRTRRSDGMFSNDLYALELLVHGESVSVDSVFYDKFTDPEGLSRAYHGRSVDQRSQMLADSLACFADVLDDNEFADAEKRALLARYAEWLLGLKGNWNVVADAPSSEEETYAAVRPAVARFIADALVSAGTARARADERGASVRAVRDDAPPAPDASGLRTLPAPRPGFRRVLRRATLRLPHGLRPNPLFDARWYRTQYPDVATARIPAYWHYWRHGIAEGRDPNPIFDTDWYLARYPDVGAARMDPLDHYFLFGAAEGRDPGPAFSSRSYLARHPDVAAAGVNPLLHYLRHGRREGRT